MESDSASASARVDSLTRILCSGTSCIWRLSKVSCVAR
jgi:hypothetical protein